ncbi:hypothetical protein ACHAWF_012993 [Thalassiosira exigua]
MMTKLEFLVLLTSAMYAVLLAAPAAAENLARNRGQSIRGAKGSDRNDAARRMEELSLSLSMAGDTPSEDEVEESSQSQTFTTFTAGGLTFTPKTENTAENEVSNPRSEEIQPDIPTGGLTSTLKTGGIAFLEDEGDIKIENGDKQSTKGRKGTKGDKSSKADRRRLNLS